MPTKKPITQNESDVNVVLAQLEGQLEAISAQIKALREVLELKITGLEKATSLAAGNMEVRLAGMNEWRQQSKDREETWCLKVTHEELAKRVRDLEKDRDTLAGKASTNSVYIAYAFSIVGVLIALLKIFAT